MRPSKSRNRNKNNRNNNNRNAGGNVLNRVFDSSGPEGKVRGTPQQIIEKYQQLTRDAQLANDRVAAENFQQHSEHYSRILAEAQKEIDARREQQERENKERQAQRDAERAERQAAQPQDTSDGDQPDAVFGDDSQPAALVDTPEASSDAQPEEPKKPRRKRPTKKREADAAEPEMALEPAVETADPAE